MSQKNIMNQPSETVSPITETTKENSILLTPKETWETLKISRSLCYHMIRTGEIKSVRFGRAIRIPKAALLEWLESKMNEEVS